MPEAKLVVRPQESNQPGLTVFEFIGTIDVEATATLAALQQLPAGCRGVLLNFAQVQRVNSMGLAQLLKLFEHWQAQKAQIRVANVNRMIGVLFKMTGLAGYLLSNAGPQAAATGVSTVAARIVAEPAVAVKPAAPAAVVLEPQPVPSSRTRQTPHSDGKLKFWVSVQSSQQMHGWYFFNTYLQRQLGREIHMELVHGPFDDSVMQDAAMDLVFTKPFEATRLQLQQQFLPIMRPSEQSDEVCLLVRADDPRQSLQAYQGGTVVTATQANFVYLLGRFLLEEDETALADMQYQFVGCDIKGLQSLIRGHADILFLLSESYRGLSGMTKSKLRIMDQSETQFAFHLLALAPHCADLAPALERVLLDMNLSSQGRQVLTDLGMSGWSKPTAEEIDMLVMLYQRYSQ